MIFINKIKDANNSCKFFDSMSCECFEALNGEDLCILHSENEYKNEELFKNSFDIYIERCKKNKYFNFSNITFVSELNFKNFIFEYFVDFRNSVINEKIDLYKSVFENDSNFSNCIFNKISIFNRSKFKSIALFFESKFVDKVDFMNCIFYKEAYFINATFDSDILFHKSQFYLDSYFTKSIFNGVFDASESIFKGRITFRESIFNKNARFSNVNFNSKSEFSYCKFNEEAGFSGIIFDDRSEFYETVFNGNTNFSSINSNNLIFIESRFNNITYFHSSKLGEEISFYSSKFNNTIYFCGNTQEDKIIFQNTKVDFSNCLGSDKLIFRNADLRKCKFSNTDIRKTEFTNVIWNKKNNRIILYDEEIDKHNDNLDHIEKLYRELKQNSEDRKDYVLAGEFNISEKEMKLKNPKTDLSIKTVLLLYKTFSNYNESIKLPILWSLFIILYSSLNFYIIKFDGLIPLNYEELDFNSFISSFHESLRSFVLTQKALDESITATWVYTFEKTMSPILLAMLGLTINQKLKR